MSIELDLAALREWTDSVDPASTALDDRRAVQVGLALDRLEAAEKRVDEYKASLVECSRQRHEALLRAEAAEAVIARVRTYRKELATAGDPEWIDALPARYFFEGNDADVVEGLDAALNGTETAKEASEAVE
jgi:hypothetical protein